ncbi:hypothetical protein Q7P37_003484 [Cladosporium fusiforme]
MYDTKFPTAPAGHNATTTIAMESGEPGTRPGGSSTRRNTIATPVVDARLNLKRGADEEHDEFPPFQKMKFPWSSPSAPTSPLSPPPSTTFTATSRVPGHRRTLSGSIFSRIPFLRPGGDISRPPSSDGPSRDKEAKSPRKSAEDDVAVISPVKDWKEESTPISSPQSKTARKRKGSLRKTALLGGRRFATEGRERKNSLLQRGSSKVTPQEILPEASLAQVAADVNSTALPPVDDFNRPVVPQPSNDQVRRQFSYESSANGSSDRYEPAGVTTARLSILTGNGIKPDAQAVSGEATLSSPLDLKSPVSQTSYASTTDDDDLLTFDRPAAGPSKAALSIPPSTSATFFPGSTLQATTRSMSRSHRSRPHRPSPLTRTPVPSSHSQEDLTYTYAETEYWGWVLLATTWIIFTVGMGSCLDVWSWAWDVGETPYAPPELEDDPTLPIVGYYPALIVLTGGVVSWIWITVAWVGLKYFRHAKSSI